jgi:peptidoglycan hydrolase-like protein with peptidoglycan-binding domain
MKQIRKEAGRMQLRYHANHLALRNGTGGSAQTGYGVDARLLEVRNARPRRRLSARALSIVLAAAVAIAMIPVAGAQAAGTASLKYGMRGTAVKTLQIDLAKRGYLKSTPDGKFGPRTKAAVKLFQKQAGLKVDGVAGAATQELLCGLTGNGKTNLTLKYGNKNSQVKIMQQRLNDLGFLKPKADGRFGPNTKAAVKLFQSKAGLKADGIAGPATLLKLYSSSAPKYMTKGEQVVEYARQFLGIKYVYGKADPSVGFDCSGLVYYIHLHYFNIKLPRSAQGLTVAGKGVALADARPGDILCFGSSVSSVGHVGIYIGNNQYIHAPQTGEVVKITKLTREVATVRRIFDD